jgi:hypothetical protein
LASEEGRSLGALSDNGRGKVMALKRHERFPALGERLRRHGLVTAALFTSLAWVLIIGLGWVIWSALN